MTQVKIGEIWACLGYIHVVNGICHASVSLHMRGDSEREEGGHHPSQWDLPSRAVVFNQEKRSTRTPQLLYTAHSPCECSGMYVSASKLKTFSCCYIIPKSLQQAFVIDTYCLLKCSTVCLMPLAGIIVSHDFNSVVVQGELCMDCSSFEEM